MINRITFLIILGLIFSIQESHSNQYNFYFSKSQYKQQMNATFHFILNQESYCTGVFVSPDGLALTNLHCLESCLDENHLLFENHQIDQISVMNIRTEKLADIVCKADMINETQKTQSVEIKIKSIFGPGFLSPREKLQEFSSKFPEAYMQFMNLGYESYGDLVLIEVPISNETTQPCVKINPFDFSTQTQVNVFNFSYPVVFRTIAYPPPFGPEIHFAMGDKLLYSNGRATKNLDLLTEYLSTGEIAEIKSSMGIGTFLSSIDLALGASGSPIYNEAGDLIGIARLTFNADSSFYKPWMSQGIDLKWHQDELWQLIPKNGECL